ncbi:hypothetical protein B0T26DRAFT_496808 [Lasiosphaeria miniovina]|uniref:Ubiquitin-like protease family profile domain-containing protein n=1 Tax=Lasiosphaeria miniovina TaxID=1954250 RepID=A0AA39ZTG0_9PEZI|nr:uncharacterized protein B0T26DRAFT_496808 [Lasiosphaeria miniovina]KAK0703396.1 hypothetical protein B0T26DRAFT_496808 [Lasiosphaeria miniovina]
MCLRSAPFRSTRQRPGGTSTWSKTCAAGGSGTTRPARGVSTRQRTASCPHKLDSPGELFDHRRAFVRGRAPELPPGESPPPTSIRGYAPSGRSSGPFPWAVHMFHSNSRFFLKSSIMSPKMSRAASFVIPSAEWSWSIHGRAADQRRFISPAPQQKDSSSCGLMVIRNATLRMNGQPVGDWGNKVSPERLRQELVDLFITAPRKDRLQPKARRSKRKRACHMSGPAGPRRSLVSGSTATAAPLDGLKRWGFGQPSLSGG